MIRMQELVDEAMSVGALGFATSRTLVHRRGDGEFIPRFDADSEELVGIAATVGKTGRGRSEGRSGGEECVSRGSDRWTPDNEKKHVRRNRVVRDPAKISNSDITRRQYIVTK